MSEVSEILALPYLQPAQAQKHVTHNEALRRLDVLVQPAVSRRDLAAPPADPAAGERHIVAAPASGAWTGQEHCVAAFQDGAWSFFVPQPGWQAWVAAEARPVRWDGAAWDDGLTAARLGLNASADATNRLAVAAPAVLLSHDGAGHQLKINKAAAGDTASLLFQTGWSGRAEIGLAGEDALSVKVSTDGSGWLTALRLAPDTGAAALMAGTTIDGAAAYHRGNLLGTVSRAGGVPSGAVIEQGSTANGQYVRWADRTQICTRAGLLAAHVAADHVAADWSFPAAFAGPPAGVSITLDGAAWGAAPPPSGIGRGDVTAVQGTATATTVSVQGWAAGGAAFGVSDLVPFSVTAIGRWA